METMAHRIYATKYQAITSAVMAIEEENPDFARRRLEDLATQAPSLMEDPADIQALFFVESLRKRLDPDTEEVGNLYLIPDAGRQIQMFNLMAEKFPVVRISQEIVNSACIDELNGQHAATIMDIGIGTGQQMVRLLEKVFRADELEGRPQAERLSRVTVIGIEPAVDSLRQAEADLKALAEQYGVSLQFHGIRKSAEDLDEMDWQALDALLSKRDGKLLINGSFALHHIRPSVQRTSLFNRLKPYGPALLTLIEPYADFLTGNLGRRFTNAWHHYGLVFRAIDQIDAIQEDKNALKSLFFRREIQDVLSDDSHRVEQFETGEMWITRLEESGFQVHPVHAEQARIPNCPSVAFERHAQYLTVNVDDYPILSIIAAS